MLHWTNFKKGGTMESVKQIIRDVADFPKEGIIFKDITPLLGDPIAFQKTINTLNDRYAEKQVDAVVGVEARGFIFGPALAYSMKAGFVPIRKPNKLPAETEVTTYELEYGTDSLEIHKDAVQAGDRIIIADDLLATGGTALAAAKLVERCGGVVVGFTFVVELEFLNGRNSLADYDVISLIKY